MTQTEPDCHQKCRSDHYSYKTPEGELKQVARFPVPQEKVGWAVAWSDYSPVEFTAPHVKEAVWADPDIGEEGFIPKWNTLDGNVSASTDLTSITELFPQVCHKNFQYYQAKARRLPNHLISLPFVWEYQESLHCSELQDCRTELYCR